MEKSKYFKVLINNMENSHLDGIITDNNDYDKILEYFIAKKRTNVTLNEIQKATSLKYQDVQKALDNLFKQGILNNGQPNIYGLNLKNQTVEKILENYFLGGIKKLEQDYENEKISHGETYIGIETLSDQLIELQKELGLPEEFDFENEFTDIYTELNMACELKSEHEIKVWKEKGLIEKFKDYKFEINWPYKEKLNPDCEVINIHLTTKDGKKYVSDYFTTLNFIKQSFEKNKKTGENVNGTYDEWYNVIIVKKLTHKNIKKTLDDLIKEGKIERFFDKVE